MIPRLGSLLLLGIGLFASACAESRAPLAPEPDADPLLARQAANSPGFVAITTGDLHACALTASAEAYCWGANGAGQLGAGAGASSATPVKVGGGLSFASVQAGNNFTCGLTHQGQIFCWGANDFGQFGDGTTGASGTPVPAGGGLRARSLAVGVYHVCAVDRQGTAYCWGASGADGVTGSALGSPAPETCVNPSPGYRGASWPCSTTPIAVPGGIRYASVDGGLWYSCGRTAQGEGYCWGWNLFKQLGDGTSTDRIAPVPVATQKRFRSLETGAVHACGLTAGGEALCWGAAIFNWGQLGNGSRVGSDTPVPVTGELRFASLAPSRGNSIYGFTCGVTHRGDAYCWGANRNGQLGSAGAVESCGSFACSSTPVPVSGGIAFREVSAGSQYACGVARDGRAYCWGQNLEGRLGNGTTDDSPHPYPVAEP